MTPIANEKRELLIEAKKRGGTEKSISKWLKISGSSVTVIWRLYCETGSYLPTPALGENPFYSISNLKHRSVPATANDAFNSVRR